MIKTTEIQLLKEFFCIVRDILHSNEFEEMKNYRHHVNVSLYDHSVKVAFLCFKHHKKHKLKINLSDFVRAALLHDFYLYDLHGENTPHRFHWFRHPAEALENALERYPNLTHTQKDMIKRHMFPLTPIPPCTKAGWLVCLYDKIAAISDRFGKNKWKRYQVCLKKRKEDLVYNIS